EDTTTNFAYLWTVTGVNAHGDRFALPAGTAPGYFFTADEAGTYTATLLVTNKGGQGLPGVSRQTITVVGRAPQAAIVTGPGTAADGTTIGLAAVPTDPGKDNPYVAYLWMVSRTDKQGIVAPVPFSLTAANGSSIVFSADPTASYTAAVSVL